MSKIFLVLSLFVLSFHGFAADQIQPIIVKIKSGHHLPLAEEMTGYKHLFDGIYLVFSETPEALKETLARSSSVARFYDNHRSDKRAFPKIDKAQMFDGNALNAFNDPQSSRQWHILNAERFGVSVLKTSEVFGKSTGTTITVAVVDSGVDYNHPDLKNVMWRNPREVAGNNVDDDGNGYVDDIHGLNMLSRDRNGRPSSKPMDNHAHGTHVSGIIAAEQNNNIGVSGVASNVRILAVRAVPDFGDETDADVAEAFLYAAKSGAKIINCSFGKSDKQGDLVYDTISHIGREYGVLVVAAAGNDSVDNDVQKSYPASYDNENLLVVASTTSSGGRSGFSNYGRVSVDLGTPGSNVFSTMPGSQYGPMSGTSMASPVASGIAADVLSRFPQLGPVQLKELLMRTAVPVNALKGITVSGGRADLFAAIQAMKTLVDEGAFLELK